LSAQGVTVEYHQIDLTDAAGVEMFIEKTRQRFGQLNGILHAAAGTNDALLLKKSDDDFRSVLGPKVRGTLNLDGASRELELDFFILFSSVAAVTGNCGQTDYACANAFLDRFSAHRNSLVAKGQRHGRTLSLNWPLWKNGGLTVSAGMEEQIFRDTGMRALSSEAGFAALYQALSCTEPQVLIVQGDLEKFDQFIQQKLSTPEPSKDLPARGSVRERDHFTIVETATEYLGTAIAAKLKLDLSRLDPDENLERYGMDSIKALQVLRSIEPELGPLSKTLFFEHQTLRELAGYFAVAFGEQILRLKKKENGVTESFASKLRITGAPSSESHVGTNSTEELQFRGMALDVAVIGVAGRYPQARNLEEFWANLQKGRDCITEIPEERWRWEEFFTPDRAQAGKHYSKWGGFIADVDKFDPLFFNIAPREANFIDPQERLFLEHAWAAMEDAGYGFRSRNPEHARWSPQRVGVYAGVMYGDYQLLSQERGGLPVGNSYASIANRVSYVLDLHGPSMTVDTMCSSSLTCIELACRDLKDGRTDMALAGGVNLTLHPNKYLLLSGGQFLSEKGRCESFGQGADGYIPSEGVGVVVLKRLEDAERDGDYIYGVIKGAATNHGGRSSGYSVPNPNAQREVIIQALEQSGIDPRTINYVEAHGTGTTMGDPVEIGGLTKAFSVSQGERPACWLGSVKSNIGHCESAAGIAGLTKVLLQMRYGKLVPSLHSSTLNPHIEFEATPFVVNRELREWNRPVVDGKTKLRAAGISSFGAGGSNAHLILQEHDRTTRDQQPSNTATEPCLIVLSAKNDRRLSQKIVDLLRHVEAFPNKRLADLAFTLQVGRKPMDQRVSFVCTTLNELQEKLRSLAQGQRIPGTFSGRVKPGEPKPLLSRGESNGDNFSPTLEKLSEIARLWVGGADVDWNFLYCGKRPSRVPLPSYPFARDRYWLDAAGVHPSPGPEERTETSAGSEEGFHSRLIDRLLAGAVSLEEAIRTAKEQEHAE
jgi:polyketide synthase PksN